MDSESQSGRPGERGTTDAAMSESEQESVFRRWVEQHTGLMLKVVRGWAASPEDQEDLFQDVLLQLWSSLPSFRGEAKESTWIYRVAFNTALGWRRGEQRRRRKHEALLRFDPEPAAASTSSELAEEREVVGRLYEAIRQLPDVDASLAMMHLDGLSYREMAEVVGITENLVGVRLNRIRNHLARELKGVVYGN